MSDFVLKLRDAWRPPAASQYIPAPSSTSLPLVRRTRMANLHHRLALATGPVLLLRFWDAGSLQEASRAEGIGRVLILLASALLAVILVETIYAMARRRRVQPGWYVPALLFTLLMPMTAAPLSAAIALALGVVLGRLVFGGAGKYFVSPALLGGLILYASDSRIFDASPFSESQALACGAAALYLAAAGTVSWRTLLGGVMGVVLAAVLLDLAGASFAMAWHRHLVTGAFAFALVFLAGEPGCAPMTRGGRWFLGLAAGVLTVLIRSFDPAHPNGVLHAILLAALFAPLADWLAVRRAMARRRRRERAWP